jgi:hypothetical protein
VPTVNRLQRLLGELLPGQRQKEPSALRPKAMLSVRPPARHRREDPDAGWPPNSSPTWSQAMGDLGD